MKKTSLIVSLILIGFVFYFYNADFLFGKELSNKETVGLKDKSNGLKNVVLIAWDGTQRNHLTELLSGGQLPNLEKLISEGSLVYTEVTT